MVKLSIGAGMLRCERLEDLAGMGWRFQ
jgi:hypothetical protein